MDITKFIELGTAVGIAFFWTWFIAFRLLKTVDKLVESQTQISVIVGKILDGIDTIKHDGRRD